MKRKSSSSSREMYQYVPEKIGIEFVQNNTNRKRTKAFELFFQLIVTIFILTFCPRGNLQLSLIHSIL